VLVRDSYRASPSFPVSQNLEAYLDLRRSDSQEVFLDRESSEMIDILLLVGFPFSEFVSTAVSLPASLS
jgi:hypothetical protein